VFCTFKQLNLKPKTRIQHSFTLFYLASDWHPIFNMIFSKNSKAKQLIRSNKLGSFSGSSSTNTQKSFDSCDSGIDTNLSSSTTSSSSSSSSGGSSGFTNSSKITASSSCSFITSFISSNTSADSAAQLNYTTSKSSTSSGSGSGSGSDNSYDQVYTAPSSSSCDSASNKTSSSTYLMSPIDESGYLVPVVNLNFNNKISLLNSQNKATKLSNGQSVGCNNQLTRSFSTRSAYATSNNGGASAGSSHNNNNQILSSKFNQNRVTICEPSIERFAASHFGNGHGNSNYCVRCNAKLDAKLNHPRDNRKSVNRFFFIEFYRFLLLFFY
jgi:hypothetical protein